MADMTGMTGLMSRLSPGRVLRTAVAWGFLANTLRGAGAILLLPLILRSMPSEGLGVWYVMVSIVAAIPIIDDGFAGSVSRAVAYLRAGAPDLRRIGIARLDSRGPEDCEPNHAGIRDMVGALAVYYRIAALGCWVLLVSIGSVWIWRITAALPDARVQRLAWLAYCTGYCLSFTGQIWPSLLVGVNAIKQYHQTAVVSSLCYYAVAIPGLLLGLRIWALVLGILAMEFTFRFGSRLVFLRLTKQAYRIRKARPQWRIIGVLWPNSWRTGLRSLGAYMAIPANTLVCSAFLDLRTTASFGLTIRLVANLVLLSVVWVHVKTPVFHQLRVRGEAALLAALFASRARLSLATYAAGALFVMAPASYLLNLAGARTELLPLAQRGVLLLIWMLQMNRSLYFVLALTENVNPFAGASLITGLCVAVAGACLAPMLGIWGVLLAMGAIPLIYVNWFVVKRGVAGLGLPSADYWRMFLGGRPPAAWRHSGIRPR